ncbi:MAG: hypothetical protein ACOYNY_27475 [Caldilineaceae bacterium]
MTKSTIPPYLYRQRLSLQTRQPQLPRHLQLPHLRRRQAWRFSI